MIPRRIFLKDGGLAVLGLSMVPGFVLRAATAARPQLGKKKILVTVFQRGGVDGLNVVVPYGEKSYYDYRPTIAVPAPSKERSSALDLDGFFGLHPSLQPLLPFYKSGELAVVHAAGSPHATRSHFEAQDYMESAVPGTKSARDGWLNRYLHESQHPEATAFRGIGMGPVLPRALRGTEPALALGGMLGAGEELGETETVYGTLYSRETDSLLSGTSREMFEAIKQLKSLRDSTATPANGVRYPQSPFGRSMRDLARLIKSNLGIEVAFVDVGGWDTHAGQGSVEGTLSQRLGQYAQAISAFRRDLGDRMADVVILTMSEFGRTARENGNAGTDHGKANVMFVLGAGVKGGKVYGQWPGLARELLNEDRDLAMTTDFRDVFAEVLVSHMACQNPDVVFPQFTVDKKRFRGVLG